MSEAVPAARPLIDELRASDSDRTRSLLHDAARAIAALHRAGVYHVDLTGENLLVDDKQRTWIIDFDRAFLGAPDQTRLAGRALERLWRSLTKLSGAGGWTISADLRCALSSAYKQARCGDSRGLREGSVEVAS